MLPYVLILGIMIFCIILDYREDIKKTGLFISASILILFIGFRYNVGTDYMQYTNMFKLIKSGENVVIESGYKWLNILFPSVYFTFFFTGAISIFFLFQYFSKKKQSNYIAFIYYCIYLMQWNTGTIRQGVAIAAFLFSTVFLVQKKMFKYFLIIFLGTLFHKSLILCFIIPFFHMLSRKHKMFLVFISFLFMIFFFFAGDQFITFLSRQSWLPYNHYFSLLHYIETSTINVQFLVRLSLYSLILFFYSKKLWSGTARDLDLIFSIASFMLILNLLFMPYGVALRALKPFEIFVILEITTELINRFISKERSLIKIASILFLASFHLYSTYKAPLYYPYETVFFQKDTEHIVLHSIKFNKLKSAYESNGWDENMIKNWFVNINVDID